MRIVIGRDYHFEAAHFLEGHPLCGGMHGHTYQVRVEVLGDVDPKSGMVIDFHDLDAAVNAILKRFDHKCLNESFDLMFQGEERVRATVENLSACIARLLIDDLEQPELPLIQGVRRLLSVQVWEGLRSYARWDFAYARPFDQIEENESVEMDGDSETLEPLLPNWDAV